ncbi:uncharacterized protein CELE_Y116A8C.467 [Caenorhabditis elegans]|uniref:Uncharacterized protein n=1 Tax=Caenorhabditis elegans TaxID=6239 RepID=H8ESG2_CAEEL|nr:Uncharacterized protein CELE_Y116A8C.467 [Caenorhabditis elegans]CCG28265.1 Uncharacterized protein CELE_Y116A8C.467 [Caenorhabditis elegans]|eukprot:NP_001255915.1 Uncharacterized protein CELE_Y116A8C.467 [Caenorhabditis elegans]
MHCKDLAEQVDWSKQAAEDGALKEKPEFVVDSIGGTLMDSMEQQGPAGTSVDDDALDGAGGGREMKGAGCQGWSTKGGARVLRFG